MALFDILKRLEEAREEDRPPTPAELTPSELPWWDSEGILTFQSAERCLAYRHYHGGAIRRAESRRNLKRLIRRRLRLLGVF